MVSDIGKVAGERPARASVGTRAAMAGVVRAHGLQFAVLAACAAGIVAVSRQPWVEPAWLFLDVHTAGELSGACCPAYFGAISTLGVMAWTGAATVCLFAALVLWGRTRRVAAFALAAGALSGVFALDDAFLLHEEVLPGLGVPQIAVLAVYAGLGAAHALFAVVATRSRYLWLLGVALAALASSLWVDLFLGLRSQAAVIVEDGSKFFGIIAWCLFHLSVLAERVGRAAR
ncbi:MAG: hypothetical protein MI723_10305 [Caulobacterales bacterium]|nr:hypothetical protein [Caulobacterales bacterium]